MTDTPQEHAPSIRQHHHREVDGGGQTSTLQFISDFTDKKQVPQMFSIDTEEYT